MDSIPWVRCASGNVSTCQVASLALVLILATRWRYLNCLPMWPPDGTTCISCRIGQQLALLELVTSLVTKWCHLHQFQCWPSDGATCIATLPRKALLTSSVGIELLSSSARVTSVKSAHSLVCTQLERSGPIDRTPGTPGSDKNGRNPGISRKKS